MLILKHIHNKLLNALMEIRNELKKIFLVPVNKKSVNFKNRNVFQ